MDPKKLDEIRRWWEEIHTWERQGKAVDIISFADTAHEYIPLLLAELDRRPIAARAPARPPAIQFMEPPRELPRRLPHSPSRKKTPEVSTPVLVLAQLTLL